MIYTDLSELIPISNFLLLINEYIITINHGLNNDLSLKILVSKSLKKPTL